MQVLRLLTLDFYRTVYRAALHVAPCSMLCLTLCIIPTQATFADTIRVAVASNFGNTMRNIANEFELKTSHKVLISNGSTGKHTTQIMLGAPFDVFFAADTQHPSLLETKGFAQNNSRFTYAFGQLALWSRDAQKITTPFTNIEDIAALLLNQQVLNRQASNKQTLNEPALEKPTLKKSAPNKANNKPNNPLRIALANPKLAPYGRAAQQVLSKISKIQDSVQQELILQNLIQGENVNQAFQYIYSEHASIGFVALSQIKKLPQPQRGSWQLVPTQYYQAIEQQAVIIHDSAAVQEFINFVRSPAIRKLINDAGYAQQ